MAAFLVRSRVALCHAAGRTDSHFQCHGKPVVLKPVTMAVYPNLKDQTHKSNGCMKIRRAQSRMTLTCPRLQVGTGACQLVSGTAEVGG